MEMWYCIEKQMSESGISDHSGRGMSKVVNWSDEFS